MKLILFAVVPRDAPADGLERMDGQQVSVLYEAREQAPSRQRGELVEFGTRLQRIAENGPLLPMRFGTVVEEHSELVALVAARESSWAARLGEVSGHVEMIIHATEPAPAPAVDRRESGRAYLTARAASFRHEHDMRAGLESAVAEIATGTRLLSGTDDMRLACLIPAGAEQSLRRAVERWAAARAERGVVVTGPWPPFSFADGDPKLLDPVQ